MSKNLRQLREKAATKAPSVKLKEIVPPADNTVATQRFIKKHVVAHHEDPAGNGDDVYNASNIKPVKRSPEHGYDPGQDEEVYEEVKSKKTERITPEAHARTWLLRTTRKGQKRTRRSFSAHMADKGFSTYDTRPFKKSDFGYKQAAANQDNILKGLMYSVESAPPEKKEHINEVLDIENMTIKQVIDDFVKSKNPKFAGKSKKERIQMALGAWYDAHPNKKIQKEEYSSLNPLRETDTSTDTYVPYEKKLKADTLRDVEELSAKTKAMRLKYDKMNRENVLSRMLSALGFGLKREEEDLLTNLYNTLNEENREKMIKLMESEEGFIKLIEFAVEKGID